MTSISTLVDRVKIFALSSGTGAFQLGSAVPAYRGVEVLIDSATYSYAAEDGSNFEAGTAVYNAETGLLIRSPQISSNGGSAVSFPPNIQIAFTALAADIVLAGAALPILDSLGEAPDKAISQKAATDAINSLADNFMGALVEASEDIAAGDFVNFYSSNGTPQVRRASALDPSLFANGYVTTAIANGEPGFVTLVGFNIGAIISAPYPEVWLSDTSPGGWTATPPYNSGSIIQALGPAIPGSGIFFTPRDRVLL